MVLVKSIQYHKLHTRLIVLLTVRLWNSRKQVGNESHGNIIMIFNVENGHTILVSLQ